MSQEQETSSSVDVLSLIPYHFEPKRTGTTPPSSEDKSEGEDAEDQLWRISVESRLGNTEWCSCGHCIAMPTARESFCCIEVT